MSSFDFFEMKRALARIRRSTLQRQDEIEVLKERLDELKAEFEHLKERQPRLKNAKWWKHGVPMEID
jgi:predicted nuclease with TOPRIM domain